MRDIEPDGKADQIVNAAERFEGVMSLRERSCWNFKGVFRYAWAKWDVLFTRHVVDFVVDKAKSVSNAHSIVREQLLVPIPTQDRDLTSAQWPRNHKVLLRHKHQTFKATAQARFWSNNQSMCGSAEPSSCADVDIVLRSLRSPQATPVLLCMIPPRQEKPLYRSKPLVLAGFAGRKTTVPIWNLSINSTAKSSGFSSICWEEGPCQPRSRQIGRKKPWRRRWKRYSITIWRNIRQKPASSLGCTQNGARSTIATKTITTFRRSTQKGQ